MTEVDSSQPDLADISAQFCSVNAKLDQLLSLKEKVDTLLQLPAKVDDLLTLKTTLDEMKVSVSELKNAVEFNSAQYDELLSKTSTNEKEIKALKSEVSQLRTTVTENATRVVQLQLEVNEAEQYNRLPNLEIHGMAMTPNEDLKSKVADLALKLAIASFQPSDILAVHRLPSKKDKTPPVLIRFTSAAVRETWTNARGKMRVLIQNNTLPKLYFNENLTQMNRSLFWKARARGKEMNFKFVWVRNGRIFAKRQEEATPVRIICERDLEMIN